MTDIKGASSVAQLERNFVINLEPAEKAKENWQNYADLYMLQAFPRSILNIKQWSDVL